MNESARIDKLENKIKALIQIVLQQHKALEALCTALQGVMDDVDGVSFDREPFPVVISRAKDEIENQRRLLDLYTVPEGGKLQ